MRDRVESYLLAEDATLREFWVLSCLSEQDASSQSELSRTLNIDASDMVRLIDSLEDRGWASRERDPMDRRRQIVAITAPGQQVCAELSILVSRGEQEVLGKDGSAHLREAFGSAQAVGAR